MKLPFWGHNTINISAIAERKEDFELIDVCTPVEFRSGHINYAKNVPLDKINQFSGRKDQPVYVICQTGMRSKRAAKFLRDQGYDAKSVRGGMNQWDGPVRKGK